VVSVLVRYRVHAEELSAAVAVYIIIRSPSRWPLLLPYVRTRHPAGSPHASTESMTHTAHISSFVYSVVVMLRTYYDPCVQYAGEYIIVLDQFKMDDHPIIII
jgi:hypothetical protein